MGGLFQVLGNSSSGNHGVISAVKPENHSIEIAYFAGLNNTKQQVLIGPRKRAIFAFLTALVAFFVVTAAISTAGPLETSSLSLYQGQGVDANLRNVLPDLLTGDLRYEESFFTGLGYYHPLETFRVLQSVFDFLHVPDTSTGLELIALKHYGLQHNYEADAAYMLRFPNLHVTALTVRFGASFGLSYALGRPTYEDGSIDDPDRRYRFQHYGSYELEWGHSSVPRVGLVTRIHHRSGMYGVIAPRRVGSNFVTIGLRYGF